MNGWANMSQKMSNSSVSTTKQLSSKPTTNLSSFIPSGSSVIVPLLLPLPTYATAILSHTPSTQIQDNNTIVSNSTVMYYRSHISTTGIRIHYRFSPEQLITIAELCVPSSYPAISSIPSLISLNKLVLSVISNDILYTIGLQYINYAITGETTLIHEENLLKLYSHYGIIHRGYYTNIARRIVARGTSLPSKLSNIPIPILISYLYSFALGWEFDQDVFTVIYRELYQRQQQQTIINNSKIKPFPYSIAPEYEWSRGIDTEDNTELLSSSSILPLSLSSYYSSIIVPTLTKFSSFGTTLIPTVSTEIFQELNSTLNNSSNPNTIINKGIYPSYVYHDPSLFSLFCGPDTPVSVVLKQES